MLDFYKYLRQQYPDFEVNYQSARGNEDVYTVKNSSGHILYNGVERPKEKARNMIDFLQSVMQKAFIDSVDITDHNKSPWSSVNGL